MNFMNSPQPSTSITLTGVTAELNGQVFTGNGMNLMIGRQPGCQIQISNSNISRQHARITNQGGQWMVEDLNSSNGTSVNGQRIIGSFPIRSGDRLGLGKFEFIFNAGNGMEQTVVDTPNYQAPPAIPQSPPQQQFAPPPLPPQQQQPYYPPQQPAYTPMPPAEPKKKRRPCLVIALILFAIICIGSIIVGLIFGVQIYNEIMNLVGQTNIQVPGVQAPQGNTTDASNENELAGSGSLQVSTHEGGVVTTNEGASLVIPPGAVPRKENGESGQMTFSMVENSDRSPTFSNDLQGIGKVYEMGPEGFTFTQPVTLVFPIPADTDPATVLGATYYDEVSGTWKTVPATVDETNRLVTVDTTHFSLWSIFGSRPQGPSYDTGTLRVVNDHRYNSGSYPPAGGSKPYGVTYGVCIDSYALDDPEGAQNWSGPSDWMITVSDYRSQFSLDTWDTRSRDYRLPTGTYTLTEVWFFSEVNTNPLDLPEYSHWSRPYGSVYIGKGDVARFTYTQSDIDFSTMTPGRPVCFGVEDTSVGTGDVQVTLTWDSSIDLDLYVEDPAGDAVSYFNTPITSGGQLDRDNACGNFISGRPENIFWPDATAPSGTYTVRVDYYGSCDDSGSVAFTVRTVIQGQVTTYDGVINEMDSLIDVTTFTIP